MNIRSFINRPVPLTPTLSHTGRGKLFVVLSALMLVGCRFWLPATAPNPDPNHTHADIAVWIGGKQLDFSDEKYMSGSSKDEPAGEHEDTDHKHPALHLHDGVGHVIHRHRPGLALKEFFDSIGFDLPKGKKMHLYVNRLLFYGENPLSYIFNDGDHLLLTDASIPEELERELKAMTDDACRYSQTCPRRGKPPAENCVADPAVPCTE